MKIVIETDEVWPVFNIRGPYREEECVIDIPDDLYREYLLIQEQYDLMQTKLKEYHEQSEKIRSSKNAVWPPLHESTERFYGTSFHTKRIRHA